MRCDLKPITSRISYKAAKHQDSVTLLGECGAEKLLGKGEMYFKSQQHHEPMYLKGAVVTDDEIEAICSHIREKYGVVEWDRTYKFSIDVDSLDETMGIELTDRRFATTQEIKDTLFSKIILWALGRETISGNQICKTFDTGERKSYKILERLHKLGIVSEANGRRRRKVLPTCVDDLLPTTVAFLEHYGYNMESIQEAFDAR